MLKIIPLLAILGLMFAVQSCKHCVNCTIEYTSVSGDTVKLMDKCGKKKVINEFEKNAGEIADTLNGTIVCSEE